MGNVINTFAAAIIVVFTAASPQFLPLYVCVVLTGSKIITNLVHIVEQQVRAIVHFRWLVRVHGVVKMMAI